MRHPGRAGTIEPWEAFHEVPGGARHRIPGTRRLACPAWRHQVARTHAPRCGSSAGNASGKGLDAPATSFAANGSEVATVMATSVERGWQDVAGFYEPDPDTEHVAITFEIESVSSSNPVVASYDFPLLDAMGVNTSRSFVKAAEDSRTQLMEDDVAVASGETVEMTLVFELFEGTELGYVMWQPDSGIILLIDLAGEWTSGLNRRGTTRPRPDARPGGVVPCPALTRYPFTPEWIATVPNPSSW